MTASGTTAKARLARLTWFVRFAAVTVPSPSFAQGWQHLGAVQHVERLQHGVELSSGNAKVQVSAFRDGVVRVRVAPEGSFAKDSSWAVIQGPEPPPVKIEEDQNDLRLLAGSVQILIHKSPLLI